MERGLYLSEDNERIWELLFWVLLLDWPILHICESNNSSLFIDKWEYDSNILQYLKYNSNTSIITKWSQINKASFWYNSCIWFHIEWMNAQNQKHTSISHIRTLDIGLDEREEIVNCYASLANEAIELWLHWIRIKLIWWIARYFDFEKEYNYQYFITHIQRIFVKIFWDDWFIEQFDMKYTWFEHYVSHYKTNLMQIKNIT